MVSDAPLPDEARRTSDVDWTGVVRLRAPWPVETETSVSSAASVEVLWTSSTAVSGFDPSVSETADAEWRHLRPRRARTPLGERLMRIRERIVASGESLLDWEDIERITAEWRGERK